MTNNKKHVNKGQDASGSLKGLIARKHDSGFDFSHDTYNGLFAASDGKIYYVLSSVSHETGAQMYSYDPGKDKIQHLGDLTEACGEKGKKTVAQGKSHVPFFESKGKLYFATHLGYYNLVGGREKIGDTPQAYKPYTGGHFLSFDLTTKKFKELAKAPHSEGILTMGMDPQRRRLYGITWPSGRFIRYDMARDELKDFGRISRMGESGVGEDYRTLCRAFAIDPRDGMVYFTNADGEILRYNYDMDDIEVFEGVDMKLDYFGKYDPSSPGHMGYNWRQVVWYEPEKAIYGVHGNSGYLFRFDPSVPKLEIVERISSLPSKKSGMFDQFYYGYLGFTLGPDGHTLYYLTGGPIYIDGKRLQKTRTTGEIEMKGFENLHLVTYNIPEHKYTDNGPVFLLNGDIPSFVNSIAVDKNDVVYTLARISGKDSERFDLISIPGPFEKKK